MTPSTKHGQAPGKRKWTAREKFRAVVEAATLSEQDLGGFLRREGLHEAEVQRWREAAEAALGGVSRERSQKTVDAKRMKALERELRRKEQALAEAAALLVLKKKSRRSGGTRTTA